MIQKQVSVLGCGWLGLPLAETLIQSGYTVKGSTTTSDKLTELKDKGISPYLLNLDTASAEEITPFLQGSEVLLINIPPKLKTAATSYPDKMRFLLPHIIAAGINKVLFVSSTSVYADAFPFSVITEDTPPNPDAENGRQILEAEQVLRASSGFKTTIVRPSGLIGGSRHPINQLAGRTGIAHPDAPINLVHRDDVVQIITAIVEREKWGEVFNAAHPHHPTRKDYYTAKALENGLAAPQFNHEAQSVGKIISSQKVTESLGIDFIPTI